MPFPSLAPPPRPPELPAVPVPPSRPTITAAEVFPPQAPPLQKWVEAEDRLVKETSLRLDAFLSKWIEEFIRVMKDAWTRLTTEFNALAARVLVLETRVSDTYTFGQRGTLAVDQVVALPLRVVRPCQAVELTVAAETPSTSGSVKIDIHRNDTFAQQVVLGSGQAFVATVSTLQLTKDQKLTALINDPGTDAADVVVQIRCR